MVHESELPAAPAEELPDDDAALEEQDARIRQRIRQRALTDETGMWSVAYMLGFLTGTTEVYIGNALDEIRDEVRRLADAYEPPG